MTQFPLRRAVTALMVSSLAVPVAFAVSAAPAVAATPTSHDAIGSNRTVTAVSGGLRFTGWAADPDSPTANTVVSAVVDGRTVAARTTTSIAMAAVTKAHGLGPTPGYALTVPVVGNHTVCVVAKNTGTGLDKVLTCVLTPLGRTSSRSHSPRGAIQHGWASKHAVIFSGWADDPDDLFRASKVTLYIDGQAVQTATTTAYEWPRPTGASYHSAFAFRVPVATGSHLGCLWATNVGLGQNTFLGCKAVDTRYHQAPSGLAPTADNAKVVAEAMKHIGQRYVYGAAGPKKFDCSGLVTYSYAKFGYLTPHQSGLQFTMARSIPAAKAQPGDLVFYHDSTGSVYHVGIYLKPGMTVAAIDEQEGVDYQPIYSSTWATYGSFTHT